MNGQSSSSSGHGVEGYASAGSGETIGGYFTSNSINGGTGAFGYGTKYGIEGDSGFFGVGVYGHNLVGQFGSGDGVYGQSDGNNGRGVVGYVPSNTGLTYAAFTSAPASISS